LFEICPSCVIYKIGTSITENPELTPPSFEWLPLVLINVPKFSFKNRC
jgi:hypothetical protein